MMSLPAPTGGWNAINALAEMPITDAIVMENMIPYATEVRSRDGYANHTTPALTGAQTLVSYNASTPKMLLGANGNIYDVTAAGAGTSKTASIADFTNNKFIVNGYKSKLIWTNGADVPVEYDGTNVTRMALTVASSGTTNVITNGVFAADTNWTKGTGWTIAAGVASSSGAQSANSDLTQAITPTAGLIYKVVFTVSGYSAGNVCAVVGETEGTDRAANGTYTEYIMSGAGTDFDIRADLDFVGSIDNVEVYATSLNLYHLQGSVTFKGRVYYWEKAAGTNPQSFWYAAAGAYTGELVKFDLTEFTEGGYVVACANWTHDGGQGLDDHFVVIMSTGQVLVYAGSDPGDATDWNLVGVYNIGEPVGLKPVTSLGGDLIVITKDGYIVLSAAIQDGRYSENSHYSFKIAPAASTATRDYGTNFGWEAVLYTAGALFIVNVPISATNSTQHVRNTTTGAWCKFTGINATTFCVHNGGLYFAGTDGKVYRYRGVADNSGYIPMRCTQAYSYLGSPHNKKLITAIEVMCNYAFPSYLHSDFWADFNEQDLPAIDDPPEPASSDWDVATWDASSWGVPTQGTYATRRNAHAFGYAISHTLRLRSRTQRFIWYASHIYAKQAGVV